MNFEYVIEGVEPADMGEAIRAMQFLGDCGIPLRVVVTPGRLEARQWFDFFNQHLNVQHFTELPDGGAVFVFNATPRTLH